MTFSVKPEKCSAIRPHLNHSDEVLFEELHGTIVSLWRSVNGYSPKYSLEDAVSDAWEGFVKAKKHDNSPPSIAGNVIECPECGNEIDMPEVMEGDDTADPSSARVFDLTCDSCNHKWQKVVQKSSFSTCAFSYMRGEIQRGARESRRCGMVKIKRQSINGRKVDPSIVSVELFNETSNQVCKAISVEHNTGDNGISIETKNRVRRAISNLPNRQCEVISRMYGIEYNGEIMEPMTQAQVADLVGITRQRICAIVKGASDHLKKELEKYYET